MEVVNQELAGQEMAVVDTLQLKVENSVEQPAGVKKILGVTCCVYPQENVVNGSELTINGNVAVRVVYLDELDKFDSQDAVVPFNSKIVIKDLEQYGTVQPECTVLNCQWTVAENNIKVTNIVAVTVVGVRAKSDRVVTDLTGDVEVKKVEHKILTFRAPVGEKFTVEDSIELDAACEGVLGADVGAYVKDVGCADGRVVVKGVLGVNILTVKTVEGVSVPDNSYHEIDFVKSALAAGVTAEDLAVGTVTVTAVDKHIENTAKGPALVLVATVSLQGATYTYQTFNTVVDAISFTKELTLTTAVQEHGEVLPQNNTTVDIENNLNLPAGTPYLTRVLAAEGVRAANVAATAGEGKVTIEGVLVANVLCETEDHAVVPYLAEVPFQTCLRDEAVTTGHELSVTVTPLLLNVKARRGVELLLDAKLGISVQCRGRRSVSVVAGVQVVADKPADGSAIRIYIIGDKENLWDLAKRTNLASAELIKQNPNLANGCPAGERIVVYRHEKVELA